jgi:hypothetical protein
VPACNAAAALAVKVKRFRFAAKVWKRAHCFIPLHENNYKFLLILFDFFEEHRPLSGAEQRLHRAAGTELALAVKKRAAFWKQRSKFRAIKEGDENSKFFHEKASQRFRRNHIRSFAVGDSIMVAHDEKAAALHGFYHELLGRARETS